MARAVAGCFGLVLGALAGAALGVGAGLLWTNLFHTSCFEGYCGMLAFFTLMPIGAILGAIANGAAPSPPSDAFSSGKDAAATRFWRSPITGRNFPAPVGVASRHTANAILRQASPPKAF
jgi:hypothetical protein